MSDITGSQSLGYGFSLYADVNPTAETATVDLKFEEKTIGTWSLSSTNTSVSVNLSEGGYGVKGSITANWSSNNITYSLKIKGLGVNKSYSGTLVKW
jgi:hypothetical protein